MLIRFATASDASAIQAIYAPVVQTTAISFEYVPPTTTVIAQRIAAIQARFPWLVAEEESVVIGYAYAGQHRERAAYQWAVDISCYIHADWRGQGVGRTLYRALCAVLRLQGIYQIYADITLPNPASVALHTAIGMRPVGIYAQVGYKLGAWHDVGWWQGSLQPLRADPPPPRPLPTLLATDAEVVARVLSETY